jgi:phage/plasmid-like protein (TIGR03299 family)
MSHNLNFFNGRSSMMYVNEAPWHGLGQRLDHPATAEEAIEAANLDYTVVKKPLQAVINGKRRIDVPDYFATVRTDTQDVLGVVGSRYSPVQNRDAFGFFDSLVGQNEAIYETAGALNKGEKIWILARLPGYIKLLGRDVVQKYLLLYNSHDGSSMIRAKLTPIRVVCNNTLSVALAGMEQEVRIKHTPSALEKLEEAHKLLGLSNSVYDLLDTIFKRMALTKVTDKQLIQYVEALVPDNPESESKKRTENIRETILSLHQDVEDAKAIRGTAFGAYNAITEYTDHVIATKDPNRRLNSAWFGSGERLKVKAFQLAQDMLLN